MMCRITLSLLLQIVVAMEPRAVTFPAGTTVPIRFLTAVTSGRDSVGTPVVAQTFAAMVSDSCVVVPPFALLNGHVARSVGGRRLGRSGQLEVVFDSLEIDPGVRVAIHAVLDTLEYSRSGQVRDSGVVHAHTSRVPIAIGAAASVVEIVPAALFGGYLVARKGARASILTGEVGAVRLVEPVTIPDPPRCSPVAVHRDLHELPALPQFVPYASDKSGRKSGDAINLIFLGPGRQIDSAFRRAGWVAARPASLWALTREVTAAIASRPAVGAPVSTLYFEGRREDLAYELAGPNARIRHHVRIWLLDSLAGVWVGAGTKDIGLRVRPLRARATHRIDSNVDRERDVITSTLESVGCADLQDYIALPGADTVGHTIDGQRYSSDGRSAVLRLRECPSDASPTAQSDTSRPRVPRSRLLPGDSTHTVPSPGGTAERYYRDIVGVMFYDTTSGKTIRTILSKYHASVVAGGPALPYPLYYLQVPDPGGTYTAIAAVAQAMRREPGVSATILPQWRGRIITRSQ
jgi:hypothetical protein